MDTKLPRGDSAAAEKPCQQRPQHRGRKGGVLGAGAGVGADGSASPADQCQVCWHWVLAADRSQPGCALQALLQEEPRDHLRTAVWQQAMLAIAALRYLPSPCFGWHLSTASGPGPGRGAPPIRAESDGDVCRASALPCSRLVRRAGGIRSVLWPRPGSGREEMPPGRAPPTASVLPRDLFPRGAWRHCSQPLCPIGPSLCSSAEAVPEGQTIPLLDACFSSVFCLPPKEDMQGLDTSLYHKVSAG